MSTKGGIYFTEPGPNPPPAGTPPPAGATTAGGCLLRGAGREGHEVAEGIERPNGIMLSRDEQTLYVNNSNGEDLLAFDVKPDGTLGNRRNFAKYQGGVEKRERRLCERRRWPRHRQ